MPTAFVYRRALRRFATSIVFTILNLVVCALMVHWVAGRTDGRNCSTAGR